MKKICIATIVLAMAINTSCGGSNDSKTVEQQTEPIDSIVEEVVEEPSFLVKSIEINYDVAGDNKVTFEYDELDRLIKVTSHRNIGTDYEWTIESTVTYGDGVITCEAGMRKLELTLDGEGYVKKSEYFLEGEGFVQRYKYKSGKLSECIFSFSYLVISILRHTVILSFPVCHYDIVTNIRTVLDGSAVEILCKYTKYSRYHLHFTIIFSFFSTFLQKSSYLCPQIQFNTAL